MNVKTYNMYVKLSGVDDCRYTQAKVIGVHIFTDQVDRALFWVKN